MRGLALALLVLLLAGTLAAIFFIPSSKEIEAARAANSATQPADNRESALALLEAVKADDGATVQHLLNQLPSLASISNPETGETPLHLVRSVDMAKRLVQAGAKPEAMNRKGETAARYAASEWRSEISSYLETIGGGQSDAAYLAATGKVTELQQLLMKDPALLDGRSKADDALGSTRHLMHIAATYGQTGVCDLLLKSGADVNVDGGWANSQPLENAAWAGYPETVKLLVDNGADLEWIDNGAGHTALWYAAITGRVEVVKILLDAGAKIEPELVQAVRDAAKNPYFGRALPPKEAYEQVAQMLEAKQKQ